MRNKKFIRDTTKLKELDNRIINFGKSHYSYWGNAIGGEVGELMEVIVENWDKKEPDLDKIGLEIADVYIYLVLTSRADIKFNLLESYVYSLSIEAPTHWLVQCRAASKGMLMSNLVIETGHIQNSIKKYERDGDMDSIVDFQTHFAKSLQILFELSYRFNISFEEAIETKITIIEERR